MPIIKGGQQRLAFKGKVVETKSFIKGKRPKLKSIKL